MEIVSLDGQFALKVPLKKEYIRIKKYEPYGDEVKDATIATITEDMYVDWEVSSHQGNVEEFLQSVRDCCQYGVYAKEDIGNYQILVGWQDDFGEIESNKTYYDSRVFDGMGKDFISSELKFYDSNDSQIPQKSKEYPFWIEVHTETSFPALHICFRADTVKLLGEHLHFILDTKIKYVILEACRVFAVLRKKFILDSKNSIQHIFKIYLDYSKIADAFGLTLNECRIYDPTEQNDTYLICPKDMRDDNLIIENFPIGREIFNQYELTFTRCTFKFSNKNKKHDLLIGYFEKPIKFDTCIFKIDIAAQAIFKEKISFKNSIFECPVCLDGIEFYGGVDFQSTTFRKEADFHGALFGNEVVIGGHENTQPNSLESSFFAATFESDVRFEGTHFCHKVDFSNANFKETVQFYHAIFERQVLFSNVTCSDYINFNNVKFLGEAIFLSTHFGDGTYFTGSSFKQNACFQGVTFHGNANFDQVEFQVGEDSEAKSIADFSGAHFQKTAELNATFGHDANFKGAIFNDNAYFDGAIFQGKTNFNLCHFYQSTYFYGAIFKNISQYETFKGIPFYQTNFHSDVYLSSDLFDFDFEHLQIIIDQDKDNERSETKANKLRQMFRGVKNSFIEAHNYLDAAHYHKMELYCKEIELGYRRDENVEKSGIRDIVDRIQLMLYRLTSDHHTDLLLILNNVIILIACFGLVNFILNILLNRKYFDFSIQKVFMAIGAFLVSAIFIFSTLFLILNCWKGFSLSIDCFKNKLQVFKTLKDSLYTKVNFRTYLVLTSYCIMAIVFAVNPSLFLPILGQLLDNNLYIGFTFASLNIAYAILMFLLIWSLQKTARKNTIVPN